MSSNVHLHAVDASGDLVEKGLKTGALTLKDSVVIGLASVAPAYSLAATLGYIIIEVGQHAPAAILVAFIPMVFTAFGYRELNAAVPDCGTNFVWGTKAFGPWVGWFGGWTVALAGTLFLASAGETAALYFYNALGLDSLADSVWAITALGVVFILAMTWVSWRGIEISARLQDVLLAFQYFALALFAGSLFYLMFKDGVPEGGVTPSLEMFNPFAFEGAGALTAALVLGVFMFWGWESTLAINEETEDPEKTPGRAALISTVILLGTYLTVTVAVIAYGGLGDGGILDFSDAAVAEGSADDVFTPLAVQAVTWLKPIVLLSIVISALSATQTTILPTTRGVLSMAAYKAAPAKFGSVHPRYQTPGFATVVMGVTASVYYVLMKQISDNILQDSVASIGLSICIAYAITGYACAWYFRHDLSNSLRDLAFKGVFPVLGALGLTYVFVRSIIDMYAVDYGYSVLFGIGGTFVVGVTSLLLGVVLMLVWAYFPTSKPFFRGQSLTQDTPVLVAETEHVVMRHLDQK